VPTVEENQVLTVENQVYNIEFKKNILDSRRLSLYISSDIYTYINY